MNELQLLGRVTLSLIIVILLAVIVARVLRRTGVRGGPGGLRVVDRIGLSREASLAVVQIGGSALVLGVTATSVTLLSSMDPEALQAGEDDAHGGAAEVGVPKAAGAQPLVHEPLSRGRRPARAPGATPRGTGAVLDPRTWRQAVESLRDLTARR